MIYIDLNCDMGESWHHQKVGQDDALMPYLSSCNLACGLHGGDPATMRRAVHLAITHGVAIGAHPSLPDQSNFGRLAIDLPAADLLALLLTQGQRLLNCARQYQQELHHLKPHGALYHLAATQVKEAAAVVETCLRLEIPRIYGLPGSELQQQTQAAGLQFIPEGFLDRAYENGQALRDRSLAGATLKDSEMVAQRALQIVKTQTVTDYYGNKQPLAVQTLCIHGDHPEALTHLKTLRQSFQAEGIVVLPNHSKNSTI